METVSRLVDLSWEDIIFSSLLPLLSPSDWLSLRATSREYLNLVATFLQQNRTLCLGQANSNTLHLLTQDATDLRHLDLENCSWLTDDHLRPILQNNRRLTNINLSHCSLCTLGSLQTLSVRCNSVSNLLLRGCSWVTSEALEYLSSQQSGRRLRLETGEAGVGNTFNEMTGEDALRILGASGLRTRAHLRKKSRFQGKEQLYQDLQSRDRVTKIQKRFTGTNNSALHHPPPCSNLSHLDISYCDLTDKDIDRVVKAFPDLDTLAIASNWQVTDRAMKSIALNLKRLENLDISGCYAVSDKGLFTTVKHCPKIKSINLQNCSISKPLMTMIDKKGIRISSSSIPSCNKDIEPLPMYKVVDVPLISVEVLEELQRDESTSKS